MTPKPLCKQLIGFEFLGEGRNRAAYRRGDIVLKIPLNEQGVFDNGFEHRTYRKFLLNPPAQPHPLDIQYARCRLWGVCLVMEYANYPGPDTDMDGYLNWGRHNGTAWVAFLDCAQAGYNKAGKVVAYDYGYY